MLSLPARLLVASLFFISGFAALVYQVAWQRLLVVFAGGDVTAVTIIVTAFMAGLGCGSFLGGVLADRGTQRSNLLLFALAEALIAIFGLVSKPLFYDLLYQQLGGIAVSRILTTLVLVLVLLPPTLLMGLSLPLLARAMIHRLPDAAVRTGQLYGMNTLGAAAGALAATWALLPLHGIEGAIHDAALLNGICACGILPLLKARTHHFIEDDRPSPGERASQGLRVCLLVYALSGFLALALEMLWFRLLGVMLKSTAFTFGTLLAIYLAGVGAGSLAGTLLAPRIRKPWSWFLALQCGVGIFAGFIIATVLVALNEWPSLAWLRSYLDSYEPVDANTAVLLLQQWCNGVNAPDTASVCLFPVLHLGLPLLMIGPSTFLMGMSYPMLQRAAQDDLAFAGRRVGWIQAANIAGSMLGAVLVGACLLPWLGTAMTLRLLVLLSVIFGVMLLVIPGGIRAYAGKWGFIILAVVSMVMIPGNRILWARAHGVAPERIHLAEDGAGVSVLKKPPPDDPAAATVVFVNGIGQSWIPFGGIHSVLGALPSLLHPKPEDIAIIGLGSGDTLFSAASRIETKSIVCVEIIGAELETLRMHADESGYAGLRALLEDGRIQHRTGDGRQFLMQTGRRFDLIEADALRPTSAHSGNLYSAEYFRLLLSRLKPGGFAVTWSPTSRVRDTFVSVFPHVLALPHILIGSNQPVPWDADTLRLRLGHLEHRHHFAMAGIELPRMLAPYLDPQTPRIVIGPESDRASLSVPNTDLFPRDELALPALWGRAEGGGREEESLVPESAPSIHE
jgi:predicted membrane-bound spermidine synthase